MTSQLFQPDNFSQVSITYKKLEHTPDVLHEVLKRYLNDFVIKEIWQLDRAEINSKNFKVILSEGGENKKFLLRKYQNLSDIEQVAFYIGLLRLLDTRGVKVSKPVNALDGHSVVPVEGGVYVLFDFIEANYFTPSEKSFVAVAKEVAKMHEALRGFDQKQVAAIDAFSKQAPVYYNKIRSYSENDFWHIEQILAGKEKDEDDRLILLALPLIKKTIKEVIAVKQEIAALQKQIIHSDLHPHNILMAGDRVSAIVDFDAMRLSERARDTAFAIYRFGRQMLLNFGNREAALEAPRLVNLFLSGYNNTNTLSEQETRLMPALIKDEFLIKILFVLNGVYREKNFLWAKDLPKFAAAIEEIHYFWPEHHE